MSQTRGGFALVLAVLMFVLFAGIASTMLAVAARERVIASRLGALERAERAAESAAAAAVAQWSTRSIEGLEIGATAQLPSTGGAVVTAERLDTLFFLVRGDARDGQDPAAAHGSAALLVRTLDPAALEAAFPAAVTVSDSGTFVGGSVEVQSGCGETGEGVPAALGPRLDVGPGAQILGNPPMATASPPLQAAPDPLAPPLLSRIADLELPAGSVVPTPESRAGTCRPGPGNWGAVSPSNSCHDLLPVIHAAGPLLVQQGEGRGVLVVDGDLHLSGTFRFHGLVLVRGHLEIDASTSIAGAVRARTLTVSGGRVAFDACELSAAASAPALDRAFRPAGRWWVPVF